MIKIILDIVLFIGSVYILWIILCFTDLMYLLSKPDGYKLNLFEKILIYPWIFFNCLAKNDFHNNGKKDWSCLKFW